MANLVADLSVMTKALGLRAERQQVLASNIANADTPYYKARDFDFAKAMQSAAAGRSGLEMAQTSSAHLAGNAGSGSGSVNLQYRRETQSAVDGNTVDMDVERSQITENSLQYEVLTRLITDRIQGMRTALSSNQG